MVELRPLNTIEMLDAALLLLRRNWANVLAASVVGTVPLALAAFYYFHWLGTMVRGTGSAEFYQGTGIWAVAMAAGWCLHSVARGVVVLLTLADVRGESPSLAASWLQAARKGFTSILIGLVTFAAAWSAGSCLLFPALLLVQLWWVARPAALAEDRSCLNALRRSAKLTEGYRGRALGLWLLFAFLSVLGVVNLSLLAQFSVTRVAGLLGIDAGGVTGQLQLSNQVYVAVLAVLTFVALDPLKSVADVVLYLDLRIRREGADLQEQLRRLQTVIRAAAFFATLLFAGAPAQAQTLSPEEYAARIRDLRQQVSRARNAAEIDPRLVASLRGRLVGKRGEAQISVENGWLRDAHGWSSAREKAAFETRVQALERSVAGIATAPAGAAARTTPGKPLSPQVGVTPEQASPAAIDAKAAVKSILEQPEFQPLAERTEIRDLLKGIDLRKTRGWWDAFVDWLKKTLFRPREASPKLPGFRFPNLPWLQWVVYGILAIALLYLLALLIRWVVERPAKDAMAAAAVSQMAPLQASQTENALDHTVDDWERFAQEWLRRGELRQAVRALYLALLVHLHRERRIDYNRALTNWVYVRQFRGEAQDQGVLRALTHSFDEVWYGQFPCGEEQYRSFEQGVRALGTPAPGGSRG
jgi:hypothetical protein